MAEKEIDNMVPTSSDIDNMILAVLAMGFKDLGNNNYQCTKEQLLGLLAIVASEAIKQAYEYTNGISR
jgi:hypothetical protein